MLAAHVTQKELVVLVVGIIVYLNIPQVFLRVSFFFCNLQTK